MLIQNCFIFLPCFLTWFDFLKEKQRRDEDRYDREKSREPKRDMGPPSSTSSVRKSLEPSEERDMPKKRKDPGGGGTSNEEAAATEKRSRRDKNDKNELPTSPVTPPSKRDKKSDRKRVRKGDFHLYRRQGNLILYSFTIRIEMRQT